MQVEVLKTLFGIIAFAGAIYLLGGILITSPKRQAAAKREKERRLWGERRPKLPSNEKAGAQLVLNKLRIAAADWWDYFVDSAKEGLKSLLLLLVIGAVLAGIVYGIRAISRTNPEAATYICYGIVAIPVVFVFILAYSLSDQAQKKRNKTSSDLPVASSILSKPEQSRSWAPDGHVYLIKEEFGTYKIGRTKDVPNRYNTLKIQIPQRTEVVWSIKCRDHKRAERRLHRKYKTRRGRGEWFALTPEQVHEITRLTDGDLG